MRQYRGGMTEPPEGYENVQEAVEAFLGSPLPPSPASAEAAEPWVPEIADVEEPSVVDAVLEWDPSLRYGFEPDGCFVVVPFDGDQWAVAWELGRGTIDALLLPERITEYLHRGDSVRFIGRWAHVRMDTDEPPVDVDCPSTSRMFVIERYE